MTLEKTEKKNPTDLKGMYCMYIFPIRSVNHFQGLYFPLLGVKDESAVEGKTCVCRFGISDVMSSKVGACLAIKSSRSRSVTMSQAIYCSRTFITGMFDLVLHLQAA